MTRHTTSSSLSVATSVVAAFVVAACVQPGLVPPGLESPGRTMAGETNADTNAPAVTVSKDGLTLTMSLAPTSVTPDGSVAVTLVLRNDRQEAVTYATGECFGSVHARVAPPLEPEGRTWGGPAGAFKRLALTEGLGLGGIPVTDPLDIQARPSACPRSDSFEDQLAPGREIRAPFEWKADYVAGVPIRPQRVSIVGGAGYDRLNGPPSYAPGYSGIYGSWVPMYKEIVAEATLTIEGESPHVLSAGEAVDTALGDADFHDFVATQAGGTCRGANLYLQDMRGSAIFPNGAMWMVEYFCETGVARHFAIAAVDPLSGEVAKVDRCEIPCDR